MILRYSNYLLLSLASGLIFSCVSLQENQLYIDRVEAKDTVFYTSNEIFADFLTSEAWSTDSEECIKVESVPEAAYKGSGGLRIKWDKTAQGCPWLGMGIGWDNWTGKDLSDIKYTGAIEFYAKMAEGERAVLPWAIALEDFAGAQAWLGLNPKTIKAEKVSSEWVRVELPIAEFDWADQQASISNIKQILFQFEADGDVYIDEIRVVPYSGGYRQRAMVAYSDTSNFNIDGLMEEGIWEENPIKVGDSQVRMSLTDKGIYITSFSTSPVDMNNNPSGKDIVNNEGLEIAFTTQPLESRNRSMFLSTDEHLFLSIGNDVKLWDFQAKKEISNIEGKGKKTDEGNVIEVFIPFEELGMDPLIPDEVYGLEFAQSHKGEGEKIEKKLWNSSGSGGIQKNPSLWGELFVIKEQESN